MINAIEWVRKGEGKSFKLASNSECIVKWMSSSLLPEFGPYKLVGTYNEKVGKVYVDRWHEVEIENYNVLRDKNIWQIFIVSSKLMPKIDSHQALEAGVDRYLSTSGAILVQFREAMSDGKELFYIGIVDSIVNRDSGEIVQHGGYLQIFKKLKKDAGKFGVTFE